jgi:hypothetical protein
VRNTSHGDCKSETIARSAAREEILMQRSSGADTMRERKTRRTSSCSTDLRRDSKSQHQKWNRSETDGHEKRWLESKITKQKSTTPARTEKKIHRRGDRNPRTKIDFSIKDQMGLQLWIKEVIAVKNRVLYILILIYEIHIKVEEVVRVGEVVRNTIPLESYL